MYSVSKPELTYKGDMGVNVVSVELDTPFGSFTGVAYFVFPEYSKQPEDFNVAEYVTREYQRAVDNAWALASDVRLPEPASFISPNTHVSTDEQFQTHFPVAPTLADLRMSTVGPTKVSSKPDDKIGSALFCRDCEQEITDYVSGTAVMPAAEVAKMTMGRWKRQLCAACSVAALKRR